MHVSRYTSSIIDIQEYRVQIYLPQTFISNVLYVIASTIAKLPFSISTGTLWYGEDDISDLYSCISMTSSQPWLRGMGKMK